MAFLSFEARSLESVENFRAMLRILHESLSKGEGNAAWELAQLRMPNEGSMKPLSAEIRQEFPASKEEAYKLYAQAFELYLQAAEQGDGEAMHMISQFYLLSTPPVNKDDDQNVMWLEKAFAAGHIFSGNELVAIYNQRDSKYYDMPRAREIARILETHDMKFV